jgi:hypothetical protein
MNQRIAENEQAQAQLESEALDRIKLPENTRKTQVLAKHIRDSITKDAPTVTNVLRTWIDETASRNKG